MALAKAIVRRTKKKEDEQENKLQVQQEPAQESASEAPEVTPDKPETKPAQETRPAPKAAEQESNQPAQQPEAQAPETVQQEQPVQLATQAPKVGDPGPKGLPKMNSAQQLQVRQNAANRETAATLVEAGELDMLPESMAGREEEAAQRNAAGKMGGYADPWSSTGNKVRVDVKSFKDESQLFYFGMTLQDDSQRVALYKKYADYHGMALEDVLYNAEAMLGADAFDQPQSNKGKLKAAGLYTINGDELGPATANPAQIRQAIKMIPPGDEHDAAVKAYEALYGKVETGSLDFIDSADLTTTEYNAAVKEYNGAFSFSEGATDASIETYLELVDDIYGSYESPRVQKQMLVQLAKAYEAHTGVQAPSVDELNAISAQEEADEQGEGMTLRQRAAAAWDDFKSIFTGKGEAKRYEPEPDEVTTSGAMGQEEEIAYAAGGGSSGSSDGAASSYAASSGGSGVAGIAKEAEQAAQTAAAAMAEQTAEVQGPVQQDTANANAQQYANRVGYDPEMTDEQALSLYRKGATLDARNMSQISWFVSNKNVQGLINGMGMYGDLGTNESGKRNVVDKWSYYGNSIGAASMIIENLPDDIAATAALTLGSVVDEIDRIVANPTSGVTVPAGQNMYEYVLSLPQYEGLSNQVTSVLDSQAQVNKAYADQALAEEEARQKQLESDKAAILSGNGTQEAAARLAQAYGSEYVNLGDDELRAVYRAQLSEYGRYFSDGGTFWQGASAAAQEGETLRKLGSGYALFKSGLKSETLNVIDEYTTAAKKMGMTLEEYLGSAGIDSLDQVIGIAYNNMLAAGNAYAADKEAQDAAAEMATTSVGTLGALAIGAQHGAESYAADFMQTAYMVVDAADYNLAVLDIQNEYREKYGDEQAAAMYYADLMAVIDSGTLSEESAADLLDHMSRARSIFDVGYEIEPGLLEGLMRTGRESLQKDVEALEAVAQTLPESEKALFNAASGVCYSLPGMAVSTAVGGAAGSALIGSAAGWGTVEYANAYDANRAAGMSPGMAGWASLGNAAVSTLVNMGGTGTQMDTIFGGTAYTTFREALQKKGATGLIKAMGTQLIKQGHEEGVEELTELGLGTLYDLLDKEYLALDSGAKPSLSRMLSSMMESLEETDVAALGKEALQSYGMGAIYGGLFSLGGVAKTAVAARKGVNAQTKYASIDLASQMAEGNVPFTEENIGKVYVALQSDLEDPRFRKWIDSANMAAKDQNATVTAMLMGAGSEARTQAVAEAKKAEEYETKARAAKASSEQASARWWELRERLGNGELEVEVELENALDQWGKAETTLQETQNAAEKARTKAQEAASEWLKACRTQGTTVKSWELKRHADQIASARLSAALELAKQYEAEEATRAAEEAAAAERAAAEAVQQQEIDYAEDSVFADKEIDGAEEPATETEEKQNLESILDYAEHLAAQEEYGELGEDEKNTLTQARDLALGGMLDLMTRAKEALGSLNDVFAYNELVTQYNQLRQKLSAISPMGGSTPEMKAKKEPDWVPPALEPVSKELLEYRKRISEAEQKNERDIKMMEAAVLSGGEPEEAQTAGVPDKPTVDSDAEIERLERQIEDVEARILHVSTNAESVGLTEESVKEYVSSERVPLARRKKELIALETKKFNDAFGRIQQALEMDNEDAADQIQAEYDRIGERLRKLGVDTDALTMAQYGVTSEDVSNAQEDAEANAEDERYGRLTDSLSRRMETTAANLEAIKPAREYLMKTPLYVNASQAADILSSEGLKSIPQVNWRYNTQLATDEAKGAMPLDGHVLSDISAEAAGTVDVNADPVSELLRVMQTGKELYATQKAEKAEARELREKRKAADKRRQASVDAVINPVDMSTIPIEENVRKVAGMGPVANLNGNEFVVGGSTLRQDVKAYYDSIGGKSVNPVLGDVALTMSGIKSSLGHGMGPEKAAAYAAVPEIIANGEIINAEKNWENRGWDTYVVAAPIKIAGEDYMGGVIVKRAAGTQSFYVHEVLLENEKEGTSTPFKTGSLTKSGEGTVGEEKPSMNMILEKVLNVKRAQKNNNSVNQNANIDAMASAAPSTPYQAVQQQGKKSKKLEGSALKAISNLANKMGVGLRVKSGQRFQSADTRFGDEVRGYYRNGQRNAIVRAMDAGRVSVSGHEIGHAVQEQIGLDSNAQMIASWKNTFGATQAYTPEQYNHEAFAEFFWRYLTSRDMAADYAGADYVETFEHALRQKKLNKAVAEAQRQVSSYINSEADAKIRAHMVDAYKAKGDGDTTLLRKMEVWFADDTAITEDIQDVIRARTGEKHLSLEDNLRDTILFNRRSAARANECLTTAMVDQNGDVVYKSLKDAFSDAGVKGKDFDLFWEYELAKHSLDRDTAKGAKSQVFAEEAISTAERRDFVERMEREHPEFIEGNKEFQAWRRKFMDTYLVDNGFLGADGKLLLDALEAAYPNYVPTHRAKGRKGKSATIGGRNYQMRTATGSTEDVINPFDSFVDMVNSIVRMTADNDSKKKFADLYDRYGSPAPGEAGPGLGWFANEITQDMERVSVSTTGMREKISRILEDMGTEPDAIEKIGEIIGDEKVEYHGTGRVNMNNVITVRNEDGSKRYFEIYNPELYTLLAGTGSQNQAGMLSGIAKATRMMSMLTTGSNPVFGLTNAMRDFQNSVNYGSWATGYLDGAVKWLSTLWDVVRNNDVSKAYDALGGGGWTAFDTKTKKGAEQVRGEVFKGYETSNVGRFGKMIGRKVWSVATFEKVNEAIEKTSRLAEYKYGKHDLSTTEGRIEAFLAAQDVTTDFSRRGNGQLARDLKYLVPFFNASTQGIYRNVRQLSAQESDRAGIRFVKNVVNATLASALANGLLLTYLDDDEKEEYTYLSDDLKAKHMFLPNFAPDVFGDAALIRIPIDQNPLSYAVNAAVSNFIWKGETDNEFVIELSAVADAIKDNLNPVSSTILDPVIATMTNKNWYGSNIVPTYLESYDETNQYTEETPTKFVEASKALSDHGIKISPMMLQYLAEQYTGYIGQTVIPALPSEKNQDGFVSGLLSSLLATTRKRLTSDPLVSNDVVSGVYDSFNELTKVYKAGSSKRDFVIDYLNPALTDRQKKRAINEADDLIHSGGDIYEAKKEITAGYDKIDQINGRDDLTDEEKYTLTQKVRKDMIETAQDVQEIMNDYDTKYRKNDVMKNFWTWLFN